MGEVNEHSVVNHVAVVGVAANNCHDVVVPRGMNLQIQDTPVGGAGGEWDKS